MDNRRDLIKKATGLVSGLLIGRSALAANKCIMTPEQTEGPFYPIKDQKDKDNDLLAKVRELTVAKENLNRQKQLHLGTIKKIEEENEASN